MYLYNLSLIFFLGVFFPCILLLNYFFTCYYLRDKVLKVDVRLLQVDGVDHNLVQQVPVNLAGTRIRFWLRKRIRVSVPQTKGDLKKSIE